jgi:3-hydroxybutyryl-CoA dehydrogenase
MWPRPCLSKSRLLTTAIIGAGPLGRWLALAAARAGYRVLLEDVMPSNLHHAQEYIRRQLSAANLGDEARVGFVSSIEDAVREADLAIDCVPDELESKLEILWLLDRMAPPRTVLATPTTRLSITDLAACTYRPDKCVAIVAEARGLAEGHGAEILLRATPRTSAETVALVGNFWRRLGIAPRFETETERNPAVPVESGEAANQPVLPSTDS